MNGRNQGARQVHHPVANQNVGELCIVDRFILGYAAVFVVVAQSLPSKEWIVLTDREHTALPLRDLLTADQE